jgi:hypothetical protein
MKRTSLVTLLIFIGLCSVAQCKDHGTYVGFYKEKGVDTKYNLTFNFGIEQWENGKLTTHRKQQWILRCSYPDPLEKKLETFCSLERVVIDDWGKLLSGAVITTHHHSSLEGTLRLLNVDWKRDQLDFTIVYTDNTTSEVMIRLKFKDGIIYLDSFKAFGISRGVFSDSMEAIEYKIPKYTYIMNVPVEMRGLRSMDDKKWDDMSAALSKQDQAAWEKVAVADKCQFWSSSLDDELFLNKIIIDNKRKAKVKIGDELTPEENQRLLQHFTDEFAKCLAKSGISAAGQKAIVDVVRQMYR